jgi:hypothetical protein
LKDSSVWRVCARRQIIASADGSHDASLARRASTEPDAYINPWERSFTRHAFLSNRNASRNLLLNMQEYQDDWSSLLDNHPIFSLKNDDKKPGESSRSELSLATLPQFSGQNASGDSLSPSGRRQTVLLRDTELIVSAREEIRLTSLKEAQLNKGMQKSYKVCWILHSFARFELRS